MSITPFNTSIWDYLLRPAGPAHPEVSRNDQVLCLCGPIHSVTRPSPSAHSHLPPHTCTPCPALPKKDKIRKNWKEPLTLSYISSLIHVAKRFPTAAPLSGHPVPLQSSFNEWSSATLKAAQRHPAWSIALQWDTEEKTPLRCKWMGF